MPSIVTHKLFGRDVIKKKKINNLDMDIYDIFNQSFDTFLYYKFFSLKKDNDGEYLKKYGHRLKTREYFLNIASNIKKYNLNNDPQCRAYLFGSINHYIVDSTFHPYVFYKTGVFNKDKKETYKYDSLHTKMEFMLDCYFYEKITKNKFYKHKTYKYEFPKVKYNDNLSFLIDQSIKDTFHINNASKIHYKALKTGRFIFRFGVYDRFGIKKIIYSIIDIIRGKKRKKIKYVSSYVKNVDPNYLNLERNTWFHPANKAKFNYSVDDLYNLALKKSIKYFEYFDNFLNNQCNYDTLKNNIDNVSYINGLNNNSRHKLKYFEF